MGIALALVVILLAGVTPATSSTFELSGTVMDPSGLGLSNVTVTLVHETTGVVRTTTSNASGRYGFPPLAPGEYSLTARAGGYATSRFAGLRYFADTKPIFNVTLRLREVQESMTFTGEAPLINVSQSQIGLSVEIRQLEELPLTGRGYLELADLEGPVHEIRESPPGDDVYGAPLQTVNGANAHYTSYQLDGFANTRDQHGVAQVDVDVGAVEEFRVISGQFSAEYGQSLAGIVSATTKSGGNDFHGTVFAYLRPGTWDSSDPLTGQNTALDRQEVGFTLSGPIKRERTQFFASYSYQNQNEDVVVTAPYDEGRFGGVFELPSSRHRLLVKLAHQFNARHYLSVKTAWSNLSSVEGVGGYDIYDNRLDVSNEDAAIYGTWASELGSHSNELRFGLSSERFRTEGQPPPLGAVEIHPTLGNVGNPTREQRADETHVELADTLSLSRGNHSVKTGFSMLRIGSTSALDRYADGVFFFSPTDPMTPMMYWQSIADDGAVRVLERNETHAQLFVQDDWQLTPYFSVNLGLRWLKETSVPDNDNFAPRLGFLWDATEDGRTAVRGGYGLFYNFVFSIVDSLEALHGAGGSRVVAAGSDDAADAIMVAASVPGNLYLDAKAWAQDDRTSPSAHHFTLGVERELLESLSASIDVSHVRGNDLILPVDLNAPAFFDYTTGAVRSPSSADATRPFGVPGQPIGPNAIPELPEGYPFDGYRDLYLLSSRGSSRFWGVKVNVTRRYAAGIMLQAVYQWSGTENDGDDFRITESLPLDPARPDLEWGRSATDIPHGFVLNGVWDAPFGTRVTGVFRARSGRPVDPRVDTDLDGDLKLRERGFSSGGILARNSFRIGSTATLDVSFAKLWELDRGRRIEAALDVFNLTNRLNPRQFLRSYGASPGNALPTFLDVVQAGPPRQFQLSVRFAF